MTDPIRSALKRLLSAVLDGLGQDDHPMGWARVDDAIDAARAALAEPEPEVVGPSVEELDDLFNEIDQSGEPLSWRAYARAVLSRWGRPAPTPPAEGEVAELARLLRLDAELDRSDGMPQAAARFDRAADLLERQAAPVPVSDRLPELRGMFERILCVARSSNQKPVGNIELADRLIKAVVSWGALPLPIGKVK